MTCVTILCVPRSGSSMLAGVLHRLGVSMGSEDDLSKGKYVNPFGSYEDQQLLSFGLNVLIKSDLWCWFSPVNYKKLEAVINESRIELKGLLNKNKKLWGWKDPLMFHWLPFAYELIKDPKFIFLERSINSVVESQLKAFFKVNGFSKVLPLIKPANIFRTISNFLKQLRPGFLAKKRVKSIVKKSYKRINYFLKDKEYLKITFDELLNDSEKTIGEIIKYLNLTVTESRRQNALEFIHPEFVHS